ncbi:MAG: tRNA lysidine(34) synthetase TilS [Ferruginibacter sp.]
MELRQSFEKFISSQALFTKRDRLLIAVSGGVDSVVLCELCALAGFNFSIAHANFKLRGVDSDADETFVAALATKYKVSFYVKKFDTNQYAIQHKKSIQVAARELRYEWFNTLLQQAPLSLQYLLTAHHADDNTETIMMNFFKGTGINGLKGILPKQQKIIRPLLFASKTNILSFAQENSLAFRQDASNAEDKYTRNYFRNQLIPDIQKVFPQVIQNLQENVHRFKDIYAIYHEAIALKKKKILSKEGSLYKLPVLRLLNETATFSILYEIIKDFGFSAAQTGEVEKLLYAASGRYVESASHRILRNRKWLLITERNSNSAGQYLLEKEVATLAFEEGQLTLSFATAPLALETDPNIALLDEEDIQFPLILRKWKMGDYFYPLGMPKKKKISRFLIDQKLSLAEKEHTWVVVSNQKIIWVLGKRIDDRFKITPHTVGIVKLHLSLGVR